MEKGFRFNVPWRIGTQDFRQNFYRGLHQAFSPARLLGFEAVHVHRKFGSTLNLWEVEKLPAFELRAIRKIGVFGERVVFPATGFIDGFAAPHPGSAVKIEKRSAARAGPVLDDK